MFHNPGNKSDSWPGKSFRGDLCGTDENEIMVCRIHLGAKIKPNSWRLQKEIARGYEIRDLSVTAENRMAAEVKQFSICTKATVSDSDFQTDTPKFPEQKEQKNQSKRQKFRGKFQCSSNQFFMQMGKFPVRKKALLWKFDFYHMYSVI